MKTPEFFFAWRFLCTPNASPLARLALGLSGSALLLGSWLFFASQFRALGAALLILGAVVFCSSTLLLLFSAFTAMSIIGLALGISFLIWTVGITTGFQDEFRNHVVGVNGHIFILKYGVDFSEYQEVISQVERISDIEAAAPFVFLEMMITRGNRISGAMVKGIDPKKAGRVLRLPEQITEPELASPEQFFDLLKNEDLGANEEAGIVVGEGLARKLGLKIGMSVRLISALSSSEGRYGQASSVLPRSLDLRVSGIFRASFAEFDNRLVYINIRNAQRFIGRGDVVSGIEIKTADLFRSASIGRKIVSTIGGLPYRVMDWKELNQNLFTMITTQKLFAEIAIGIIVVVAAFNILSALAVLVLFKTADIAVLKSLGMSLASTKKVFRTAGLIIWVVSAILGLGLGYLGSILLAKYGFPLDPEIYLIEKLPILIRPLDYAVVAAISLFVSLLATVYPTAKATRIDTAANLTAR